jgi:[protein-PII] uridylyltransferase
LDIKLINARISTLGERVEDIFFVSNDNDESLSTEEQKRLGETLKERL